MNNNNDDSTVAALSTSQGFGAIAIIRLSGEKSLEIVNTFFRAAEPLKPRQATLGKIFVDNDHLDDVIVTFFQAPKSYTGENIVEISCHGSPFIVEKILEACYKNGARPAQPGEFTKRAFLNGKIDLSQAEGVNELIRSRTQAAHQTSKNLLEGNVGKKIREIKKHLVDNISLLELELDFGEEEIDFTPKEKIVLNLQHINEIATRLIKGYYYGRILRNGIYVSIVGAPNSGKSSLLNAFLQEERVIVSPHPGTTRDIIEESIRSHGFQFRLIDTAGLRQTEDEVESLGIALTEKSLKKADLILFVVDINTEDRPPPNLLHDKKRHTIVVLNKADISNHAAIAKKRELYKEYSTHLISAKTHVGIHELSKLMAGFISKQIPESEDIFITKERHFNALTKTHKFVKDAISGTKQNNPSEFIVTDLRLALESLDEILGKTTNDEILNNIFNNFCIGK